MSKWTSYKRSNCMICHKPFKQIGTEQAHKACQDLVNRIMKRKDAMSKEHERKMKKKPRRKIIGVEYYCRHYKYNHGQDNIVKVSIKGNICNSSMICVFCGMMMVREWIWNRPEDKV